MGKAGGVIKLIKLQNRPQHKSQQYLMTLRLGAGYQTSVLLKPWFADGASAMGRAKLPMSFKGRGFMVPSQRPSCSPCGRPNTSVPMSFGLESMAKSPRIRRSVQGNIVSWPLRVLALKPLLKWLAGRNLIRAITDRK